jgi:hypothetical protein
MTVHMGMQDRKSSGIAVFLDENLRMERQGNGMKHGAEHGFNEDYAGSSR